LTLACPPANSYSYEMMCDLDQAILAARMDEEADVIVLTGDGDRFFCAGADVAMLDRVTPRWKYYFCLHANETLQRLEQTPKLVIAALNGHCVGGGLEVALAADLRVARRAPAGAKPFQIGLPEVKLGVLPGTGGTQRLTRLVGPARAIEWMAEARTFDADAALAAGLINRVLPAEGFLEAVQAWADSFTLPGRAALAVGGIKRAVQGGGELPLASGLALERELQQRLFESADAREGVAAFVAKREARFEGR
jgi:enoyl-CoA hydratase/carnithine racemase